ncbi:uncharacterized protein LOC144617597 isoform X2 [Crassostrea virginica]
MEMCSSRMINHNQQVISTSAMAACFVFWHPLVLVSGLIFAAGCYSFIGCNAYNDPKTLVFKQKILNSTQPVLDCYRACAAYRVFALSSDTCFCKNHSYSETDYSCTPVQFRPGSADFHGGSKGVVEYDKQINVTEINQDEVGDCVSCQQFTETCVNYRMTPCTTELSHKCKLIINAKKKHSSLCENHKYRQVVENKLAVIKKSILFLFSKTCRPKFYHDLSLTDN